MTKMTYGVCVSEYMGDRNRSSVSFSSSGSRLSFGGSIRLNDLLEGDDDYGFRDMDIEEALEATVAMPGEHIPVGEASDTDSQVVDRSSMGSNDSKDQSRIGALIDKAKSKGKKLVSSRKDKNKIKSPDVTEKAPQCIIVQPLVQSKAISDEKIDAVDKSLSNSHDTFVVYSLARRCRSMPFFQYRMMLLGALIAITLTWPGFVIGVMWGVYVSFIGFLYLFVSDPQPQEHGKTLSYGGSSEGIAVEVEEAAEVNSGDEQNALGLGNGVIYMGWMNELKTRYSPASYHVNGAQSVLVRLDGSTLRIRRPDKAVLKHAFHDDPTLKQPQPTMVASSIYDLTDAHVSLRPKRLARRRWWSRKYPIHIRLAQKGALAEVDRTKAGMARSVSFNPERFVTEGVPTISDIPRLGPTDEGYSAESETNSDDEVDVVKSNSRLVRANSVDNLAELQSKSIRSGSKAKGKSIYLFVRAAREKERWFHLLREACSKSRIKPSKCCSSETRRGSLTKEYNHKISDSNENLSLNFKPGLEELLYRYNHIQFAEQMALIMGCGVSQPERGSTVSLDLGTMKWTPGVPEENSDLVESINSLAIRIFFDFCRDSFWSNQVKQKIQSKLATIRLPYFIEKLELSELYLGTTSPRIVGVYTPKMDEWGLWVDFEMKYKGGIRLVLQTSVNLLKLQSGSTKVETARKVSRWADPVRLSRYSDEDLPESPDSSPDEDFGAKNNIEGSAKEHTSKKIISIVERAAQSSLFQKAARLPKVAKLIEDVSSTPLMLNVEVTMLEGPLTVNIPPPPSDRLWYAFRRAPRMSIRAVPQVGDRSVDVTTVSDWIESKLRLLVEKNLVCPNMDDIILPVMSGNSLLNMGYNL